MTGRKIQTLRRRLASWARFRPAHQSGLDSATAQLLLSRKRAELEDLMKRGRAMPEPLKWYDHNADNPPWIKALAEVRHGLREGWCHPHVQAIIVSIDQYAEAALGNRIIF